MKKTFAILFSVLLLLSLCACGALQDSKSESYYAAAPAEMPAAEPEMAADEAAAFGGFAVNGSEMKGASPEAPAAEKPEVDPEKIIYSADATVETTEFEQTLEKLQALVQQVGGFIESSSINGSNYYSQARGYAGTAAPITPSASPAPAFPS